MPVKCSQIVQEVHKLAPVEYAEEWDNVGLLLGDEGNEIKKVLVCLEVTEKVIEEAIAHKAGMIVAHHPFIYKPVRNILKNDVRGNMVYDLIRNDISVCCAHTNLDTVAGGIGDILAELMELKDIEVLDERCMDTFKKLAVFVPETHADIVRDAMSRAGAGWIGNYSDCSFMIRGTGTFRPLEGTNPYIGEKDKLEKVDEYLIEMICPEKIKDKVISAMLEVHPYEEVAYDIYPLDICKKDKGLGRVGNLNLPLKSNDFIDKIKQVFRTSALRLVGKLPDEIRRVAIFNGSYDRTIYHCMKKKADILITGDVKYHDARDIVDFGMCAIDVGHYESENAAMEKFALLLSQRIPEVDFILSKIDINPFEHA